MRHAHGFTLIECLTAMAVLAIICSIAVPSYSALLKSIEARSTIFTLQQLIHASRNDALNSHKALTICGSGDSLHCDGNWTIGVLIMEDANRNGIVEGNDRILKFIELQLKQATLTWQGFGGSRVTVESLGTAFASNGTFTYCRNDSDPLYSRQVIVSRGGRARLSRDTNGDGIHESSQGDAIACP